MITKTIMAKQSKSPEKQAINRNPDGTFPKGVSGNPGGKTEGTLSFKTKWFNFIEKVAKQNDITPDEVDEQLLAVAFKQAKDANYPFYRDIQDRVHGKASESMDVTSGGKPIVINVAKEIAQQNGIETE
jgi:hypothetical protein